MCQLQSVKRAWVQKVGCVEVLGISGISTTPAQNFIFQIPLQRQIILAQAGHPSPGATALVPKGLLISTPLMVHLAKW